MVSSRQTSRNELGPGESFVEVSRLQFLSSIRILAVISVVFLLVSFAPARTHHSKHSSTKTSSHSKKDKKSKRVRGQRAISPERAREIQAALIREKYLDGEPTGVWDQRTKDALTRYQADQGWQTKVVPDSRALIKLGLGPDHSQLINPDTAAVGGPIANGGGLPAENFTNPPPKN